MEKGESRSNVEKLLGAIKDPTFQIVRAIYLLQAILQNFPTRSANFETVFLNGEVICPSHLLSLPY